MRLGAIILLSGALLACQREPAAERAPPANVKEASRIARRSAVNSSKQLPEPHEPIDSKSVEAAGQVVQSYGALIEQKRWTEADALWGNSSVAQKFRADLTAVDEVHIEIGNLGEPEGAAGSIYVTMPVIFYGNMKDGQPFRRLADVILRRVNDVPGATEAQRRWHIERIDWTA